MPTALQTQPENPALFANVTAEQMRAQYAKNAAGLAQMKAKAELTGKKVNGYTAEQLKDLHRKTLTKAGPTLAVRFGSKKHVAAVGSIAEASAAWEKLRDERNLGASNSPKVTVIDLVTGKTIATISYNGRAWANDGSEIDL